MFAHRYVRAYRDGSPRRLRHADSWLVVHGAARLAEGIEVEQATLIGFLDRASKGPRGEPAAGRVASSGAGPYPDLPRIQRPGCS